MQTGISEDAPSPKKKKGAQKNMGQVCGIRRVSSTSQYKACNYNDDGTMYFPGGKYIIFQHLWVFQRNRLHLLM
jgi:hypothetical protein